MNDTILTPEEVALRWGCSVTTIRKLVSIGSIPSFRVGRLMRIPKSSIVAMEKANG